MVKKIVLYLMMTCLSLAYDYSWEIETQGRAEYKEFYIPREVYKVSKRELGDLRVIKSSTGEEVPYAMEETVEEIRIKRIYEGTAVEKAVKDDKRLTTFKFERSGDNLDIQGNILELISEDDLYTEYTLLGSSNGREWRSIKEGRIERDPSDEKVQIRFSRERYTYYRLITPPDRKVDIKEARLLLEEAEEVEYPTIGIELPYEIDEKGSETHIVISSDNLPLKALIVDIEEEFSRNYRVETVKKDLLRRGRIYNFKDERDTRIPLRRDRLYERIVLKVINRDSKPLKIAGVEGEYSKVKVVFRGEEDTDYILTVGDRRLSSPNYDIQRFLKSIGERESVSLGEKTASVKAERKLGIIYKVLLGILFFGAIWVLSRKYMK